MSTSNLSFETATAPTNPASTDMDTRSWVTNQFNVNNTDIDKILSGDRIVNIGDSITNAIEPIYYINTGEYSGSIALTGYNRLRIIKNNTNYTQNINNVPILANTTGILYNNENIILLSKIKSNTNIYIKTYAQAKEYIIDRDQKPATLMDIKAVCAVAPTGTLQYKIYYGAVIVGSITFIAGTTIGVVSISNNIIGNNTLTKIVAPNVGDATFANIGISIYKERT